MGKLHIQLTQARTFSAILLLLCSLCGSVGYAQSGAITLNFKDADINALIDTVAQATGRNFIIDPRVKARITIVSAKQMQAEELYQVFLSILQVHGFSAVPVGDVIKIVPDVTAKQGPVPNADSGQPGRGDQLVTRVVEVNHAPAAQLVPILRPLVPQQGHLAAYAPTNVLIISDRAANVERLVTIIRRIDRADSAEIEVIRLEYATASEVVRIVETLVLETAAAGGGPARTTTLVADERTNSILLGGDQNNRLRIRSIIGHLDTPLEVSGEGTQVIYLRYANAEDLVPILQGVLTGESQQAAIGEGGVVAGGATGDSVEVNIQADSGTNALVITAPPRVIQNLRAVIRQLDIRRAQVLVEAIIAEVRLDGNRNIGSQFVAASEDGGFTGLSTLGSPNILSLAGQDLSALAASKGILLGTGDTSDPDNQYVFLLNALAGDSATNIVSTPSVVTLDNEEAEIVVAQNVPFVTGAFTGSGSNDPANPFQTIERQDVGFTLRVTPQINEGNSIKLNIEQEVSSVAASAVAASDIITNRRAVRTNVLVEDGQIIALGGLIDDQFIDSTQKVPLLGDIPVVGNLFKSTSKQKTKQNLVIFIYPRILRDPAIATSYTQTKYSMLRAQHLKAEFPDRGTGEIQAMELPPILVDLVTTAPEHVGGLPKIKVEDADRIDK